LISLRLDFPDAGFFVAGFLVTGLPVPLFTPSFFNNVGTSILFVLIKLAMSSTDGFPQADKHLPVLEAAAVAAMPMAMRNMKTIFIFCCLFHL